MDLYKIVLNIIFFGLANGLVVKHSETSNKTVYKDFSPDNVFNGVYSECFLHLSYSCLQKKTLLYLKELNNLSEVSVIGEYVKFVRINTTNLSEEEDPNSGSTDELAFMIDKAVDDFFDNHILKFTAMGKDIAIPRNMEEFVGRKKRKGGGGGGMMGGHDDGGKKKMMMMAMMCMKMKLMMMVPAMMGMMGMMSFKGMMFSMMSFMLSKMMLLMKILEKKGGVGGFGGGGLGGGTDGGWAAGGTGGGAWMPAGGQDFGGGGVGGGGGGYDANGQWQSRSYAENLDVINKPIVHHIKTHEHFKNLAKHYISNNDNKVQNIGNLFQKFDENSVIENIPEISYVKPVVRFNNKIKTEVFKKPVLVYKKSNVDFNNYGSELNTVTNDIKNEGPDSSDAHSRTRRSLVNQKEKHFVKKQTGDLDIKSFTKSVNVKSHTAEEKSRKKRSILDILQNSYMYWMNRLLGQNNNRRTTFQKYKIINGVRYVYHPFKAQRPKMPKEVQFTSTVKVADEFKPIITADDFNKGEIMEGAVESRMNKKKFHKVKDTVNDTMEDNPWE